MKEKIYDARTGMEYVLVGDYYLPALKLPRTRPIGRWGMLHKAYLKLRKPAYYQSLLLSGKLDTVLANVEEQAVERYEVLIEQAQHLSAAVFLLYKTSLWMTVRFDFELCRFSFYLKL